MLDLSCHSVGAPSLIVMKETNAWLTCRLEAWSIGSLRECANLISRSEGNRSIGFTSNSSLSWFIFKVSKPKTTGGGRRSRSFRTQHCLLHEAQEVRQKGQELQHSRNQSAYSSWVRERETMIQLRSKACQPTRYFSGLVCQQNDKGSERFATIHYLG